MTRTEYDVVALGELLIDFTAQGAGADGYPLMAAHPGGAPANFLAAIARLGGRTALLSKVGADAFGTMLTGTLREVGVDTRGVVVAEDAFTTLAFVTLDARGERSFSFARKPGADTQLRFDELDLSLLDEARLLHFGSLSLTSAETLYYLKSYAVLFVLGILGSTPVVKNAARRMDGTKAGVVLEAAAMLALLIVCTAYLVDGSFNPFLYFRF